jgi:hypothetical protein
VRLETVARGQPQETFSTTFYMLRGESDEGSAPRAVFIEATGRSDATHTAIANLARQLFSNGSNMAMRGFKASGKETQQYEMGR